MAGQPEYENTRLLASFHSDAGFDGAVGEGKRDFGYILGGNTSKSFGEASGSWGLKIKTKKGQKDFLSHYPDPEDVWVRLQARVNGKVTDLMLGVIDSIHEDKTRGPDGSQQVTYSITGKDFGKCFDATELFVNFWPDGGPPVPQFASYTGEAISRVLPLGTPDQVVRGLIEIWLGNSGTAEKQWALPASLRGPTGARYIFDLLNMGNISPSLRGQLANDASLLSPEPLIGRSLWEVLQEYSHNLLNEMWVDLAPDPDLPKSASPRLDALRPSIYLRERPFPTIKSTRRWDSLKTIEITAEDVRDRRLVHGDGGASRFNYWMLVPMGLSDNATEVQALLQQGSDGKPGGIPIFNNDSIRRHGLRRYMQQSKYLALPSSGRQETAAPEFYDYAKRWTRIVHDWYSVAPFQKSGSITLARMRPEIRVGMRVRETDEDGAVWLHYVEGVDNEYTFPNEGRTTLTVTRSQKITDSPLARVYAFYKGIDVSTLSDGEVQDATPSATAAGAPTTPDTAPVPSVDPDVPIPPEDGAAGLQDAATGVGAGTVEQTVVPDGETVADPGTIVNTDATTDARHEEMVSAPEDVEDTDMTPDELNGGTAPDGPHVLQLEETVITGDVSRRRGARQRRLITLDPTTITGDVGGPPDPTPTRGE